MSASLVGSEMCIRDRIRSRSPGIAAFSGGSKLAVPAMTHARGQQTHTAVSYTHLTLPTICSV
eukprot:15412069-Alexandrium_andersonii.AAC.1